MEDVLRISWDLYKFKLEICLGFLSGTEFEQNFYSGLRCQDDSWFTILI